MFTSAVGNIPSIYASPSFNQEIQKVKPKNIIMAVLAFVMCASFTSAFCQTQIKFADKKFMSQELGRVISGNGYFYYDSDKGCFLKVQEGIIASCTMKAKQAYRISVQCSKIKNTLISIGDVVCGERLNKSAGYRKLCNDEGKTYLRRGNAYFAVNEYGDVDSMGIILGDEYLRDEGESPYSANVCR